MICTVCSKSECCRETFREVVASLRFDYILSEYGSLSDAWRVYQGVALYREYRGIGGVTKQLDVVPRPCHLCLVKIVNMAQAIYQVTSALDESLAPGKVKHGLTNGRAKIEDDSSDDESDNEEDTKDKQHDVLNRSTLTSPLQNLSIKQSIRKQTALIKEENADTEAENDDKEEAEDSRVSSRPRRSAGRSLFERKPDFALGTEFAKILRQRTMKEKSRMKKMKLIESSKAESDREEAGEGWRSSKFRSQQLSRLDSALASSGWSNAIKSGKNMENEVFKESQSEAAYISGIDQLVMHFKRGNNNSSSSKTNDLRTAVKTKRVIKPSRKILDGLDFRRKVIAVKVACSKCGLKVVKSKLKSHMDSVHNKEKTDLISGIHPEKRLTMDDNVSNAGSEFSVASILTNSSSRSQKNRKKASSSATAVPDRGQETELAEKIVDEFADSSCESEANVADSAQSQFYLNNFNGEGKSDNRKCCLDLSGDSQRPQRRKRSLEERHPDFVMSLPAKIVRKSSSESLLTQLSNKSNET